MKRYRKPLQRRLRRVFQDKILEPGLPMHEKHFHGRLDSHLAVIRLFVADREGFFSKLPIQTSQVGNLRFRSRIKDRDAEGFQRCVDRRIQLAEAPRDGWYRRRFRRALCDQDTPCQQSLAKPCAEFLPVSLLLYAIRKNYACLGQLAVG